MLAACGTRADLQPRAGESLPVAPYGRQVRPTAEDLLTRPPQAAPERSIELRRRSEEREDDPFDLPPEDGPMDMSPPDPAPAGECRETAARDSGEVRLARCIHSAPARAG